MSFQREDDERTKKKKNKQQKKIEIMSEHDWVHCICICIHDQFREKLHSAIHFIQANAQKTMH